VTKPSLRLLGLGGALLAIALSAGAASAQDKEKVVAGSAKTKAQGAMAKVLPDRAKAEMHRKMAEPGSAPS